MAIKATVYDGFVAYTIPIETPEGIKWVEPFTITSDGQTWTRDNKKSAMNLADVIAEDTGKQALVTLTETGWLEYTAVPPQVCSI